MQRACVRFGCRTGRPVHVLTGDDLGSRDPKEVPRLLREFLMERVDGLCVLYGPSWGCGHEDAAAGEFLIPRLLVVEVPGTRSAAAGFDGVGLFAEAKFRNPAELEALVFDWLGAYEADIDRRHDRRTRPPVLSDEFRVLVARSWEQLGPGEQTTIAAEFGMRPRGLEEMLFSPRRFAEFHLDNALRLAERLGVWDPAAHQLRESAPVPEILDADELAAFDEAMQSLELSRADQDRLLVRGRQAKLSAVERHSELISTRFSLRGAPGWIRLWQALCNERDA